VYTVGHSVPSSYACSGQTGIADCAGPVANGAGADTSSIGHKTFTVTATPLLGPTSSKSAGYTVNYNFGGFQPPISTTALNAVKAGSSVPIKFSLHGNFGLGILAPGYPESAPIACSGGTVDVGTSTDTAGSSTLQYDAGSDSYTYIWKTNKAWTGCRQLLVVLTDGVVRRANFQFK
jgi:hypothetical protein